MNEQFTEETKLAHNTCEEAQPHWQQGKWPLRPTEVAHVFRLVTI